VGLKKCYQTAGRFLQSSSSSLILAEYDRGMANSIWTTEYFDCPDCGLPYTATREQHPTNKHAGSFSCVVCGSTVHAWSGNFDFFDWKVDQVKSPVFGKRWGSITPAE
jgi:hypothetical protein